MAANRDLSLASLIADDGPRDGVLTICGLITHVQRKQSKDGRIWAILTVEDLEASCEVLVFSNAYAPVANTVAPDTLVRIKGRVRAKDESVEISASEVSFPDVCVGPSGPLTLTLSTARCTPAVVEQLKYVLGNHPGTQEVRMRLSTPGGAKVWRLDDTLRVSTSPSLMADLKALLGPSCVGA